MVDRGVIERTVVADQRRSGLFEAADLIAEIGFDLHFSGGEISLEILLIIIGVPETPLYIRKYFDLSGFVGFICEIEEHDLACIAHRNQVQLIGCDPVLGSVEAGITHAVSADVAVQLCLGRLPGSVPDLFSVLYIDVLAISIIRNVVITIAGHAQEPSVFIK